MNDNIFLFRLNTSIEVSQTYAKLYSDIILAAYINFEEKGHYF